MNESAKRRQDLLAQMRNSKHVQSIPAVHPKYNTAYQRLYSEKESNTYTSSFLLRFTISLICFLCFVWMDSSGTTELTTSSSKITSQIENTINLDEIQEVWKEL